MKKKLYRFSCLVLCLLITMSVMASPGQLPVISAQSVAEFDLAAESVASASDLLPEPEGPDILFFSDNFDSERYGTAGGVVVPLPWVQTGEGGSKAKTSVSGSAPSTPNLMKIDVTDSVYLPVNTTGYGNIKLSYYTRASSYVSGSIVAEWSGDEGSTWSLLEDFKLAPGTPEAPRSNPTR